MTYDSPIPGRSGRASLPGPAGRGPAISNPAKAEQRRRWHVYLAALLLIGLVLFATRPDERSRVLIVGLDGATLDMITPLMAAGRLPNLQRIAESGVHGRLASLEPFLSPIVWTTVATGKRPEKHGIGGWVHRNAKGNAELYYSRDRKTHALWNILSDTGRRVGIVNWLVTYPPDVVDGVMITDHTFAAEVEGKAWLGKMFSRKRELEPIEGPETGTAAVYPQSWTANARSSTHSTRKLTEVANPFVEGAAFPSLVDASRLAGFFDRDRQLTSVALEVETELSPDLLMLLLQGIDRVSHSLWGCRDDPSTYPSTFRPTARERENCRDALVRYYEYSDALVGRLVERFDDDDLVFVLSDHGFETLFTPFGGTGGHESENAGYGIVFMRGRGVPAGQATEMSVLDVTPTVLAWLGEPLALDFDGKVAPFLDTDFERPIPTYDTKPIERVEGRRSGLESDVIDQLRELGYVD